MIYFSASNPPQIPNYFMSSQKYAAPLALEIAPSALFAALLLCVHSAAIMLVFLLPVVPLIVSIVLATGIAAHAFYSVLRHALLRAPESVVRVLWNAEDVWLLSLRNGTTREAKLVPGSFVHPLFSVLNFKLTRWRGASLVIFRGRVDVEQFRKLRVRLLLTKTSPESE